MSSKQARVKIRGRYWSITYQNGGDTSSYGWCDFDKRRIVVRYSPEAPETLIHELIHACQPDLSEDAVIEIEAALVHALDRFYPNWRTT